MWFAVGTSISGELAFLCDCQVRYVMSRKECPATQMFWNKLPVTVASLAVRVFTQTHACHGEEGTTTPKIALQHMEVTGTVMINKN